MGPPTGRLRGVVMAKEETEHIRRERESAKAFQIPNLDLFV
ncbi:hypothetical protein ABZ791_02030 [Streptomyces huasconensis]|uniref:Uncharacterized protein n=1 Tax=Streptomyces huasconensis TaxID=1854574 RepID=A0ABV3LRL4_9ACTN